MKKPKATVEATHYCEDGNHAVRTVKYEGETKERFRKTPCKECPWRRDAPIGAFPADAFEFSARTAYDMAPSTFSCHMSGIDKGKMCAGFILRGADHNLAFRLAVHADRIEPDKVSDGGVELYDDYVEMALANGVDPESEALKACRRVKR